MLKDCSLIPIDEFAAHYFAGSSKKAREQALNWLSRLSEKNFGDDAIFKLRNGNQEAEPVVYTDCHGRWWTGRYIGSMHFDGVSIEIQPRFGMSFVASNIPLNNFIPVEIDASFSSGDKFICLIQAMLWFNLLAKAARHTLPTVRYMQQHVSSMSKGRINIRATIRTQSKDNLKIASTFFYKEINNPITTLIVLAFQEISSWFIEHDLLHWLPQTIALRLQQMVNVTPRHSMIPKVGEINSIRLSSIAKAYRPLARLSMDILRNKGVSERSDNIRSSTFLLDVAELWEIYVLDVLSEASPANFEVKHGVSDNSNLFLLHADTGSQQIGKLIPDYEFLQAGKRFAVGDAKYKRLGDKPWMSPKRDDIYQMAAYLSRYSECNYGNFYYPDWQSGEDSCDIVAKNPWRLQSNQMINFVSVPTKKSEAVAMLTEQFSWLSLG